MVPLLGLLLSSAPAFYLPGVAPIDYEDGAWRVRGLD